VCCRYSECPAAFAAKLSNNDAASVLYASPPIASARMMPSRLLPGQSTVILGSSVLAYCEQLTTLWVEQA
jgi:hypothetical protein